MAHFFPDFGPHWLRYEQQALLFSHFSHVHEFALFSNCYQLIYETAATELLRTWYQQQCWLTVLSLTQTNTWMAEWSGVQTNHISKQFKRYNCIVQMCKLLSWQLYEHRAFSPSPIVPIWIAKNPNRLWNEWVNNKIKIISSAYSMCFIGVERECSLKLMAVSVMRHSAIIAAVLFIYMLLCALPVITLQATVHSNWKLSSCYQLLLSIVAHRHWTHTIINHHITTAIIIDQNFNSLCLHFIAST